MRFTGIILGLLAVTLLCPPAAPAQSPSSDDELKALRKDVEQLKEGQKVIQRELAVIRSLLLARQSPPSPPQDIVLSVDGAPFLGEKNAKLTLVEFSDYQCPYCARHFSQTLPQLITEYVKTGKVKYVLRNFPLESMHPQAFKAAEAAPCAGEQGKYWEMHQRLMSNQRSLAPNDMPAHAQALGLDVAAFQQCLDSGKQAARVRQDITDGEKAGVEGTPTFFLGWTEENARKIHAKRKMDGAIPYANFRQAIESLLNSTPSQSPAR